MIIPIRNAAMIDTDCKPYMEFSENSKAIGKRINITAQNVRIALCGVILNFYMNRWKLNVRVSNDIE